MNVTYRKAVPADSLELAELAQLLDDEDAEFLPDGIEQSGVQQGQGKYSAELMHQWLFADGHLGTAIVAERRGIQEERLLGYLLFVRTINTCLAGDALMIADLYVRPEGRSSGVGRRLMAAVCREAMAIGAVSVVWGVRASNARAQRFYHGLGAIDEGAQILELYREIMIALAKEAE